MKKNKLILVDKNVSVRNELKLTISKTKSAEVVAEISNSNELPTLIDETEFDIVLMDSELPSKSGIETIKNLLEINSELKIMVLLQNDNESNFERVLHSGAKGFLLKRSKASELENAIKEVASGGNYFASELLLKLSSKMLKIKDLEPISINVSPLETEVIIALGEGLSTDEIAKKLKQQSSDIEQIRTMLLEKTGCTNTASLMVFAVNNNLIEIK